MVKFAEAQEKQQQATQPQEQQKQEKDKNDNASKDQEKPDVSGAKEVPDGDESMEQASGVESVKPENVQGKIACILILTLFKANTLYTILHSYFSTFKLTTLWTTALLQ